MPHGPFMAGRFRLKTKTIEQPATNKIACRHVGNREVGRLAFEGRSIATVCLPRSSLAAIQELSSAGGLRRPSGKLSLA
jgi:hypothetical protein